MALPRCWPARPVASWPSPRRSPEPRCRRPPARSRRCAGSREHRADPRPPAAGHGPSAMPADPADHPRRRRVTNSDGDQLAQGDLDGGWPDGPAVVGDCGGVVRVCGPPARSALSTRAAVGRSSPVGSASLARRGLVGAVEVVARQHGPGTLRHPGPAGAAGPAARAGEDQGRRVAAGWQLAADGLDHQRGQGNLADAGVAQRGGGGGLGRGLKPLPNWPA